jgi:hypothetical protein
VWYNSTSATLKVRGALSTGAWASGGNLAVARVFMGSAGTQTATLAFGGYSPGGYSSSVESYNGSSWTTLPATMPSALALLGSCGPQTAALIFGGQGNSNSYTFNGSSFSLVPGGTIPVPGNYSFGTAGVSTAALSISGCTAPGSYTTSASKFNGTSWTSAGTVPAGRREVSSGTCGTQTAAIYAGGNPNDGNYGGTTQVDLYNGSTWTSGTALPASIAAAGIFGTQSNYIVAGGYSFPSISNLSTALNYNGTSWTSTPSMPGIRGYSSGAGNGTNSSGLLFGGTVGQPIGEAPYTNTSLLWSGPGAAVTRTVTVS